MFKNSPAFSGFSSEDTGKLKTFYQDILGLEVEEIGGDMLTLHLATGGSVLIYPKEDHTPSTYTVLNFPVDSIDAAVTDLKAKGVGFERYEGSDENDIMRGIAANMGPDIAWFKDPSGNILSVLQEA